MKLGYFPGCSLHATAREFDQSLRATLALLDVEIEEINDWACCGATSAHATNRLLSLALPARTLALAEAQKLERVLAPCAACYSRLATARHALTEDEEEAGRVRAVLERPFTNSVGVLSIVELLRDLAPEIKKRATASPLAGRNLACYYGCLLVRPPEVTGFDDAETPHSMEAVVEAAGAKAVVWRRALDCCGGGFSLSRTPSVVRLGRAILDDARAAGAEALVVACPMCHSNLDFRQRAMSQRADGRGRVAGLSILFITEVVGLALGLPPERLGLARHFVSPRPLLEGAGQRALPEPREQA
jgi:heterodisulfide reductase subunit B